MIDDLRRAQHGIVHRNQAFDAGITRSALRVHVNAGRWQGLGRGTYATFTGPLDRSAQLWRAVLACGPGATLSHHTAAELQGLVDKQTSEVHITVPSTRRLVAPPGVVVHYSQRLEATRHPSQMPPRTRVEATVLDMVDEATTVDQALALVSAAVGRRLTTVARLRATLDARHRCRWRTELSAALGDIGSGCHSLLELRYLRDVERAHVLPLGRRQSVATRRGHRIYRDVDYEAYGVVVELDGAVAHPAEVIDRDRDRDNAQAMAGGVVLHYAWAPVTREPCRVAGEVARALRTCGWAGKPRKCSRTCSIAMIL